MSTLNTSQSAALDIIQRRVKIDRAVAKCEKIDELYDQLFSRYEMCQMCNTRCSLVLATIANLDDSFSSEKVDELMTELCDRLLKMTRCADVIVNFGWNGFAVLLVDCDQYGAAKVCQRFKETTHKVSFFNPICKMDLEFDFGIADDQMLGAQGAYTLIELAQAALVCANNLGNGAIVRASEMESDHVKAEHFVIGEPKHTDV